MWWRPYIEDLWIARMPADNIFYTILKADEIIWNKMDEIRVEKWWNEIWGRGLWEKPQEKLAQTPFHPPWSPHGKPRCELGSPATGGEMLAACATSCVTHAARALQSHDLSGEWTKLWITYILFWPHKNMEGIPGWVIRPIPGPPPRQHKHERRYTPGTHSFIPTRRIWNDVGGQMTFGDLVGLKLPDICLAGEEKPHPGNMCRSGIELGPAAWQARMVPPAPQQWTG